MLKKELKKGKLYGFGGDFFFFFDVMILKVVMIN